MATEHEDFDDFDLDLDDVDTEKLDGFNSPLPGKYHLQVTEKGRGMPKWEDCYWFDAEVLAGTVAKQEGKVQRFAFDDPAAVADNRRGVCKSKLLSFAIATGLITKAQVDDAKKNRRSLPIPWGLIIGRQLCAEVEANDKRKSGTAVKDWAYWSVDDSKSAGIPLNQGMLKAARGDDVPFGTEDLPGGESLGESSSEPPQTDGGGAASGTDADDLFG